MATGGSRGPIHESPLYNRSFMAIADVLAALDPVFARARTTSETFRADRRAIALACDECDTTTGSMSVNEFNVKCIECSIAMLTRDPDDVACKRCGLLPLSEKFDGYWLDLRRVCRVCCNEVTFY
jgi:hypothetical protein